MENHQIEESERFEWNDPDWDEDDDKDLPELIGTVTSNLTPPLDSDDCPF